MELLSHLALGFSVALTPVNLMYAFIGSLLGTLIGVLPGIGPVATIAMLLPTTYALQPVSALIMLAGLILVVGASLGSHDFRPKQVVILGLVLTIFCAFVFVGGLKLPIPLCPDIESLQSSVGFCRS